MKAEIWSDVVCPWCYIGKRHFEDSVGQFEHGDDVEVVWRSFELDPSAPAEVGMPMTRVLERKYGMSPGQAEAANHRMTGLAADVGLEYHLDRVQMGNTFDAHRLIHLAADHGLGDAMKERLMAAYFTEGKSPSRHDDLADLAAQVGLDRAEVADVLAGDRFADQVRDDERRAATLGVSGVPFFVIDEAYGVSGAQPPDVLLGALERAWSESHPVTVPDGGESSERTCTDGTCAV